MFAQRHLRWVLVALVGVAAMSVVPGLARAGVILTISGPFQPGVLACIGMNGQCVYAPATDNPAMAFSGGVEAALAQNGTFIRFAFTLQDTSGQSQYASTAITPTFANAVAISILGTAGEPVGTPVLLRLDTGINVDPGTAQEITNEINTTEYAPNTNQTIGGFHIGDTFTYWASVGALGNIPIVFQVDLSVQAAGDPMPVSAPGTPALLMAAGLALGALSLRRR